MFFKQAAARCNIAIEEVRNFFAELLEIDLKQHNDSMVAEMQDQLRWLNNRYSELTDAMMEWGVEVNKLSTSMYQTTELACALYAHLHRVACVIVLI